jgi:ATP-dependent RNA helicase TDRD9
MCARAELRRDEAGTRYVSALCGLGSTDDGAPYFPEHDILVNIDAELSVEDIGIVSPHTHFFDRKNHRINRPSKRGKEKSPSDGHC